MSIVTSLSLPVARVRSLRRRNEELTSNVKLLEEAKRRRDENSSVTVELSTAFCICQKLLEFQYYFGILFGEVTAKAEVL